MPRFRFDVQRRVSRIVELDQESSIYIAAPDKEAAEEEAERRIEEDLIEWEDDNGFRLASNDEVVERARIVRGPWLT